MELFDGSFYKVPKMCLTFLGLWPYQNRKIRLILYFTMMTLTLTMAIPQTIILVEKFGIDLVIMFENTNLMMFNITNIMKCTITFTSSNQLKVIYKQIADDWVSIKDNKEIRILIDHYKKAHIFVTVFSVYISVGYIFIMIATLGPPFLDFAIPLENGTRLPLLPYANFVLFDQYEHPYATILMFMIAYLPNVCLLYLGVYGIYVLSVGHACALLAIVCYRVDIKDEEAANNLTLITDSSLKYKLAKAISLHNQAISLCGKLDDLFSKLFLLIQCYIVVHIAMSGCYLVKSVYTNKIRVAESIVISIGVMVYFTILNCIGQSLIDSSERVFDSAYNSHWYLMPPNIRKFYIIIMCRAKKPCQLTAGKITVFSMRQLGLVIKTALSYYTVLISTI